MVVCVGQDVNLKALTRNRTDNFNNILAENGKGDYVLDLENARSFQFRPHFQARESSQQLLSSCFFSCDHELLTYYRDL